jgi:hypothetical protein
LANWQAVFFLFDKLSARDFLLQPKNSIDESATIAHSCGHVIGSPISAVVLKRSEGE